MRRILAAVLLVSMAAIAFEILLMRMLSIVQWHHFAWMVISLALLGYGASGTVIALFRNRLETRFENAFATCALAFSISMAACWMVAQWVPFNALEVVWDARQLLWLGLLYLLFMVPFLFAAMCMGMAFAFHGRLSAHIYFLDLLGAGAGAVLIIALLFLLTPPVALAMLSSLALAAALLASRGAPARLGAAAWAAMLLFGAWSGAFDLKISEFKGLSRALQTVGSHVVGESSGPLGSIAVIENLQVPFRHAPGLGLASRQVPPQQLAVFTDGGGMSAITGWDGHARPPAFLGDLTSALPYYLPGSQFNAPRVLVLGAGAGMDVLQALYHGAGEIDAVELDPRKAELLTDHHAGFSGRLFERPGVRLHIGEARGFAARATRRYDLVQIGLLDAFAVSGTGVQALNENYLYTVEALGEYLGLLQPGGVLAITRWLKMPPRGNLKLVDTAARALRDMGVENPSKRMAMIRGWSTATLLIRNGEFGPADSAAIRDFAQRRSFDTVHYPSMPAGQANRFNRWDRPWLYEGVHALLGPEADRFIAQYKFDIGAATDERPYFFNFFRWPVFVEALTLRDRGGAALIEWGYLVPAATLAQAAVAGFLLILLPLWLTRGRLGEVKAGAGSYFFLLGLAFLFVEIAFIQKFTLFLSHPLYAVAVVLAGFLVFAGIGSGLSRRLRRWATASGRSPARIAVAGIVTLTLVHAVALPLLFSAWMAFGDLARVLLSIALIAPLALFMGMPFPLGLAQLSRDAPGFIPWAWALNGFASVVSAALATLLAVEFGFTAVLMLALALYVAAGVLAPDR